ncbi:MULTISPECIES: hypothetical protein [Roseobacteraceae]|uniref:Uncharacterized protein n=1 Tax=Pseudosulfitobacter pseudonitzschiae TaxID=1402135 RepID=A0A221JVW6_9RHOB|nr:MULTISPECIES: hypothetical protein [Roseobacteraceae]ASM70889.1 hypothetical protein SULPSESMR1_00048 [Pseudosulfitobacter pseudonitzschiae]
MTVITDFEPGVDYLALKTWPGTALDVRVISVRVLDDATGSDVLIGDTAVARMIGGQGLTVADINVDR